MEQQKMATHLCEECNSNEYKYKCPACLRRTCSLLCVKSHKQRFGCTGKRDATHFVPLSQFDDSTLLSDYNMLEDVKRVAESAKRMRVKLGGYSHFRLPFYLKALRNAAARRGTKLLLLPAGMSKREINKTRVDKRSRSIYWTIEWRFHSVDVVLLEHGVQDSTTLRSVIEKHLQPSPWRNKLRRFCDDDLNTLKFFIRKYHKGTKSPYRELDLNVPLSRLFADLVILEYPVIHVFLSSDSYDFEVVQDIRPPSIRSESMRHSRDESPIPAGTVFKEEEIIEDERALETQIIDLLRNSEAADKQKPTPHDVQLHCKQLCDSYQVVDGLHSEAADKHKPTPHDVQLQCKQLCESSNNQLVDGLQSNGLGRIVAESDQSFTITNDREVELIDAKINDFDFEQDLIDAYSFLMEESNPDDFLDFKLESEEIDHKDVDCFPNVEELEEGEIPADFD